MRPLDDITRIGPEPCIGCPSRQRCKAERLSCAAFNDYVCNAHRKPKRGNPESKFYKAMFA